MTWAKDVLPSERARLMSGHMVPTEREAFEELRMVLELFRELNNEFGTVRCESSHHSPFRPVECSHEVTHIASRECDASSYLICTNAAVENLEKVGRATCANCHRFVEDCWSPPRPI